MSRYVVGIDLGTTNSAWRMPSRWTRRPPDAVGEPDRAPADPPGRRGQRRRRAAAPAVVPVPARSQGVPARGARPALEDRRRIAWSGTFAREHGAKVPGRLVSSAKSWLSHAGVDRRSPILPWTALEDVPKVSPVAASAAYLEHLRDAWNARVAGKTADRPAREPGRPPDRPRLVRRRGPRADHGGRRQGRAEAGHPPRGAPGRLLRLARHPGRGLAASRSRSATSSWSATSAAARPTSP